jgi:diguanylate cyclase (GGDEF)-like protein
MSRLKAWWSQPDEYEWVTAFLDQRGMLRPARMVMAVVAGSSAMVPLAVLPSQSNPGAVELTTGAVAATFTIGVTLLWLTRWPSRRQSQVGVGLGALFVGGWSLVQPSGALAALACTAMAVTGGYIAFYHGPKLLVFNSVVAGAVTAAAAVRLAHETNAATAASAVWIITFLNLSVPLGIWGMSRAMGMYFQRSEEDALTGLLNRRAFADAVSNRLANPPPEHTHLAMLMVDLDNFKRINDTHGHLAGDRALRAVADLLREHTPANAVICRAGGEEFLVALTAVLSDVRPPTVQFCRALGGLLPRVTASVGIASTELRLLNGDAACVVEDLIKIADDAMYAAKRRGGDQVHQGVMA